MKTNLKDTRNLPAPVPSAPGLALEAEEVTVRLREMPLDYALRTAREATEAREPGRLLAREPKASGGRWKIAMAI